MNNSLQEYLAFANKLADAAGTYFNGIF